MKIALIDADILAYQAAASVEQPVHWGDGLWTLHAFEDEAVSKLEDMVASICQTVGADNKIMVLSDSKNWRKDVLPTYKENRVGVRKPLLLGTLREHIKVRYEFSQQPSLEGDDILGILATRPSDDDYIICSLDKDLKTVPGHHYNFGKDEFFEVTEEQADYYHLIQTLTGDTTDGYQGCPGVGPKTAEKILAGAEDPWAAVVKAYAKAGFGEEEALVQARVAHIMRNDDYDPVTGKIKLWEPYGTRN